MGSRWDTCVICDGPRRSGEGNAWCNMCDDCWEWEKQCRAAKQWRKDNGIVMDWEKKLGRL